MSCEMNYLLGGNNRKLETLPKLQSGYASIVSLLHILCIIIDINLIVKIRN